MSNRPSRKESPTRAEARGDTRSGSRGEAYNAAKKTNNIDPTTPPLSRKKVDEYQDGEKTGHKLVQHEYENRDGEKITMRRDRSRSYEDGGTQGEHINAGKSGEKLKQHHEYETKKPAEKKKADEDTEKRQRSAEKRKSEQK